MISEHHYLPYEEPAVIFLAKTSGCSIDFIVQLYEAEMAKLKIGAHITSYIPLLAMRNVRNKLEKDPAHWPRARITNGTRNVYQRDHNR